MKKQSVKKASAAVTALVTALTASCAFSALGASAAGNTAFPYTMFAGSDAAGALTVNAKHFCLNGKVAANGTVVTGKKVNLNGKKIEYAETEMPYVSEKLGNAYFSNAQTVDSLNVSGHNVNLNKSTDVAGEASVRGNVNMNASLRADSDISISGNVSNFNNAVLYSEFGDIEINCKNVSLTGLIYAPLGDVVITANNINLNNVVIIADTITLNANNVNANYGRSYAEIIGTEWETKASYITRFNTYMMDREAANILDMLSQYYTVKPLDAETICASAKKTGAVIVAENHSMHGGLYNAVLEALAEGAPVPARCVAVEDEFGEVGPQSYLQKRFGLNDLHIVNEVKEILTRK